MCLVKSNRVDPDEMFHSIGSHLGRKLPLLHTLRPNCTNFIGYKCIQGGSNFDNVVFFLFFFYS